MSYERPLMHFAVGDEVVWSSINRKDPKRERVESVGRKLVRIVGDKTPYRMSDGARNDGYSHESIRPVDVWEWDQSVGAARIYLREIGLRVEWNAEPGTVVWAANVLRAAKDAEATEKRG